MRINACERRPFQQGFARTSAQSNLVIDFALDNINIIIPRRIVLGHSNDVSCQLSNDWRLHCGDSCEDMGHIHALADHQTPADHPQAILLLHLVATMSTDHVPECCTSTPPIVLEGYERVGTIKQTNKGLKYYESASDARRTDLAVIVLYDVRQRCVVDAD